MTYRRLPEVSSRACGRGGDYQVWKGPSANATLCLRNRVAAGLV